MWLCVSISSIRICTTKPERTEIMLKISGFRAYK
jgi:hypothetical protein